LESVKRLSLSRFWRHANVERQHVIGSRAVYTQGATTAGAPGRLARVICFFQSEFSVNHASARALSPSPPSRNTRKRNKKNWRKQHK
jgi:hypothetical protein